MKRRYFYILISFISFTVSTCKKYNEGGLVKLTRKHLFGGHKIGDSKTWKLDKYEVNGIDSTNLISTGGIPDFYEKHITFKYTSRDEAKTDAYEANTFLYDYKGKIDRAFQYINIYFNHDPLSKEDSSQCKSISNSQYCARNIFVPEIPATDHIWAIKKLTKRELILELRRSVNKYKIVLTY
jgi:hypothetical protein